MDTDLSKPKNSNARALVLLCALVLLVAGLALWNPWRGRDGSVRGESDQQGRREPFRNEQKRNVNANANQTVRPVPGNDQTDPVVDVGASDAVVTLEFRDTTGSLAPDVQFWLQEKGRNSLFARADGSGIYVLRTRLGSNVQLQVCGEPKKIPLQTRGYRLEPNYSAPWASRQYDFRVTTAAQAERVTVYAARNIVVRALYDDGQAYEGSVIARCKRIVRYAYQLTAEGVTVEGVPVSTGVQINFSSRRAGYDAFDYDVSLAELQSSAPIPVTIPKSKNPLGAIEVSFSGFADEQVELVLYAMNEPKRLYATSGWHLARTPWLSVPLPPGRYAITVTGKFASRIDEVVVTGGKVSAVTAYGSPPAVVRARVLDPKGLPLPRAVLEVATDAFPPFDNLQPTQGVRAVSDRTGVVTLSGIPAGDWAFSVEALGFNPKPLSTKLAASAEVDFGDVYLEEARGVCVVNIVGMKDGYRYALYIGQPGTSSGYPFQVVTSNSMRVERLVLGRRYDIGIVLGAGGEVQYERVVLATPDDPVTIELDASKLISPPLNSDD